LAAATVASAAQYSVTPLPPEFRFRNNKGEQVSLVETVSIRSLEDWEIGSTLSVTTSDGRFLSRLESARRTQDIPSALSDTGFVAGARAFYDIRTERGRLVPFPVATHATVFMNGVFTDLHPLLESAFAARNISIRNSFAADINDRGDVVGVAFGDTSVGFLYRNGTVIPLESRSCRQVRQARINNFGQVTAVADCDASIPGDFPEQQAVIYSNDVLRRLSPRGQLISSFANGLNDAGQVVGTAIDGSGPDFAFLYEGGMLTKLSAPAGGSAIAQDINKAGRVVGTSFAGGTGRAFIYEDGQRLDLNTLVDAANLDGAVLTGARSINDDGAIVVEAFSADPFRSYRALLTPVRALATDAAVFNFESGAQGWVSNGEPIIQVSKSTEQRLAGKGALAIAIDDAGFASVTVARPSAQPGQPITFRIYLPADAGIEWIQPFARSGREWHGNWTFIGNLQLGAWNTITVDVPQDAAGLEALGLELFIPDPYTGVVYLDSIDYRPAE
jgi:probable HAF family extracellular repeat protein